MKKLVFLILLFCWNNVCGHWSRCSTGVVSSNQAVSLPSSTHAGAEVLLLRKYHAPSLTDCLEECCSGKYGICSVAEYKNSSIDANCVYYSCQPILKCKFMSVEGTDSFSFPFAGHNTSFTNNAFTSDNEGYDALETKKLSKGPSIHQPQQRNFKDYSRAVTARKGVESITSASNGNSLISSERVSTSSSQDGDALKSFGTSKDHTGTISARKGVEFIATTKNTGSSVPPKEVSTTYLEISDSSKLFATVTVQDLLDKTDASFKNDNTTIKPRKGVNLESKSLSLKIKGKQGAEVVHSSKGLDDLEVNKSKVKPRKGVVPLPFSIASTPVVNGTPFLEYVPKLKSSSNDASDINTKSISHTLPSYFTVTTDLISALEQVFRDESVSPGTSSEFPYEGHTMSISASNSFLMSSTDSSSGSFNVQHTTVPLNSAINDLRSASVVTKSPMMPLHTVLASKSSSYQEKVEESTSLLKAFDKLSLVSPSHSSKQALSASPTPLLQTSMNAENSVRLSGDENTHHYTSTVLVFRVSSPNKAKMSVLPTNEESESERKYKSSMHLVLSLVFGLLVLFVVFGVVAKRVYDVWMRRHYHRMDFLIDGMYDGFS